MISFGQTDRRQDVERPRRAPTRVPDEPATLHTGDPQPTSSDAQQSLLKGFKVELAPTAAQAAWFKRCAAVTRFCYNWNLEQRRKVEEDIRPIARQALEMLRENREDKTAFSNLQVVSKLTKNDLVEYFAQWEIWKAYNDGVKSGEIAPKMRRVKGRVRPINEGPRHPSMRLRLPGTSDLKKKLRAKADREPDLRWLKSVPSSVIDYAFMDLMSAYKHYYEGDAEKPQFHSYRKHNHFSVISGGKKAVGLQVEQDRIRLVNVGWVRLKERGYIPVGRTKRRVAISLQGGDRWFVSVIDEFEPVTLPPGRPTVGIDLGIKSFAILSNGIRVPNPKHIDKEARRIRILDRRLSRKTLRSGRHERCRLKLAKAHWRVACARRTFMQQLTSKLVQTYGTLVVETLGVKDMMQVHRLARSIADCAWYEFRRELTYKGDWYGSDVIAVEREFPSTQQCCRCSARCAVNWKTRLCTCPECGLVIDMDDQAAINLRARAGVSS